MAVDRWQWRAKCALVVLVGTGLAVLVDALLGGALVDLPVVALVLVVGGYATGAWAGPRTAIAGVLVAAGSTAAAQRLYDPHEYPLLDDLFWWLLVTGAPALAGAAVAGRARQVRELRRLHAELAGQREDELRAARLQERSRVEAELHREFSERFAAIVVRAESAAGQGGAATSALADIETSARSTLDELRASLGTLRDGGGSGAGPETSPETSPETGAPPAGPAGPVSARGPDWRDGAAGLAVGLAVGLEAGAGPEAEGAPLLNLVLGLVAGVALTWWRSRPAAAAAGCFAALTAMSLWATQVNAMVTTVVPLLLLSYGAGAHGRGWGHRSFAFALSAGGGLVAVVAGGADPTEAGGSWPTLIWAALAFGAGTVTAGWTERRDEQRRTTAELERGRDVAVRLAAAEQRAALARELHDTVAHAMTVVCLQATAGQVPGGSPDGALATILATARSGLGELRDGMDVLDGTDPLAIATLAEQARRLGLVPEARVLGDAAVLPDELQTLTTRVLREAVVNAGRYAPGSRIEMVVTVADGRATVEAVDDGGTTDTEFGSGAGTGLAALAEDVVRRGGTFRAGPEAEGRWRVHAVLPLEPRLVTR